MEYVIVSIIIAASLIVLFRHIHADSKSCARGCGSCGRFCDASLQYLSDAGSKENKRYVDE